MSNKDLEAKKLVAFAAKCESIINNLVEGKRRTSEDEFNETLNDYIEEYWGVNFDEKDIAKYVREDIMPDAPAGVKAAFDDIVVEQDVDERTVTFTPKSWIYDDAESAEKAVKEMSEYLLNGELSDADHNGHELIFTHNETNDPQNDVESYYHFDMECTEIKLEVIKDNAKHKVALKLSFDINGR